jgi:hypothetical protein
MVNSHKEDSRNSAVLAGENVVTSFFAEDIVYASSKSEFAEIEEAIESVKKYVKNPEWKIVDLSLSNHDSFLRNVFRGFVADGKIVILKGARE